MLKKQKLPKILFFADRHSYLCKGVKLTSATRLISKYKWEFQRDYWLTSGAIKVAAPKIWRSVKDEHFKGQKRPPIAFFSKCASVMSPDQIKAVKAAREGLEHDWEIKNATACYRGTVFHAKMEQKDISSPKGVKNPFTGKYQKIVQRPDLTYSDNASVCDDLSKLKDGYYPELVIFHIPEVEEGEERVGIVGQVDRAWIWTDKNGVRWYASDDWKTNWDKRGSGGFGNFKGILTHLRETKSNEYGLQASIYGRMMELAGFKIAHLQITYAKDFDDQELEEEVLPYMYEEVEQMFEEHFN